MRLSQSEKKIIKVLIAEKLKKKDRQQIQSEVTWRIGIVAYVIHFGLSYFKTLPLGQLLLFWLWMASVIIYLKIWPDLFTLKLTDYLNRLMEEERMSKAIALIAGVPIFLRLIVFVYTISKGHAG